VRTKLAAYMLVALSRYPFEGVLDRCHEPIEHFLQSILSDASGEARAKGRKCFLVWYEVCPESANNVFQLLDYAVQRAVLEEKDHFNAAALISPRDVDMAVEYEEKKPVVQANKKP